MLLTQVLNIGDNLKIYIVRRIGERIHGVRMNACNVGSRFWLAKRWDALEGTIPWLIRWEKIFEVAQFVVPKGCHKLAYYDEADNRYDVSFRWHLECLTSQFRIVWYESTIANENFVQLEERIDNCIFNWKYPADQTRINVIQVISRHYSWSYEVSF